VEKNEDARFRSAATHSVARDEPLLKGNNLKAERPGRFPRPRMKLGEGRSARCLVADVTGFGVGLLQCGFGPSSRVVPAVTACHKRTGDGESAGLHGAALVWGIVVERMVLRTHSRGAGGTGARQALNVLSGRLSREERHFKRPSLMQMGGRFG